jgi:hypothetical protein
MSGIVEQPEKLTDLTINEPLEDKILKDLFLLEPK